MTPILKDRELAFLLYELLESEQLLKRDKYAEHSREVFDATLDTAKKIACKYFANHNALGDQHEPRFDGKHVSLVPETKAAWNNFAEAGFLAAHYDFEDDGMQLPEVILRAALSYFYAANVSSAGYCFLTIGAANLIHAFASDELKARFLPAMKDGRCAGTMALTEPDQGSSLADIKTSAEIAEDGSYRIFGSKMYISGGEQDFTQNIIHLILAKIKGAPAGTKGISLFICPKYLINEDGSIGQKNDVALAGLLHKMGYRNTTSTVLKFGENEGAIGYLVGQPHQGLKYMFQMMNEARIGVGMGAAVLGYQGFTASLEYARDRVQGRLPSNKDPASRQVRLVEHADVRRMLLAQKAYSEAALAMCFYASALFEDAHTADSAQQKHHAFLLLDLITPVVKSWSSKYGVAVNDLAIQVLGGAGYTREYPLEQYYRDNRLNPIHEGTEGIHGIDILGRKVMLNNGEMFKHFADTLQHSCTELAGTEHCANMASDLNKAVNELVSVTQTLTQLIMTDPDLGLANATLYLDMFGRVLAAWLWLRQASIAENSLAKTELDEQDKHYYQGKVHTARYYFKWELPQIYAQAQILTSGEDTPYKMQDNWF